MNLRIRLPAVLSIVVATFAVYWPSLGNKFVWDDTALILRDPFIRSWRLIPQGIGHFLFTDATPSDFYRPLQRITYTFDYALYGFKSPWGYHLTSIVLHAAAAVMLFFLVQKLITRAGGAADGKGGIVAWLAALAWAVHPVHSAAVSYIAGRADVLAALFAFSGLYLGLCSLEKKSNLHAWLAAFCFLGAGLSKESGCMAILIWLALLLCMGEFAALRRWLVVGAAVFAAYCALRFTAEHTPPPKLDAPTALAARPGLIARAFESYAGLVAAPVNLHMERDAAAGITHAILGSALMAALVLWCLWARRRVFPAFLFLVAFIIAYAPTSNLLSLNAHVAEHWLYFSSAFLFAAAGLSLTAVRIPQTPLLVAFACWLAFIGARTWRRNFDWKDQRTFFESTIAAGGDTARMRVNLAQLESDEHKTDPAGQKAAIADYKKAMDKNPNLPFAFLGLAQADLRARDFEDANRQLLRAEVIPFIRGEALKTRAALEYQQSGKVDLPLLLKAASLEPDNWDIQKTYIKTLAEDGKIPEAVQALHTVLEKQSYRAETWKLMGDLLVKAGRADLAATAYNHARLYDVHLEMANNQ